MRAQCGGTDLQPDQWVVTWNIAAYPADSTCVSMTPDVSTAWVEEEPLPEGRVMGNWIFIRSSISHRIEQDTG